MTCELFMYLKRIFPEWSAEKHVCTFNFQGEIPWLLFKKMDFETHY